ncbi:MAG: hypothetical protein WEE89_18115, partial [Gemmatimonadota bacterium]
PPTDRRTLVDFYKLVRPPGGGWNAVRSEAGVPASPDSLPHSLLGWVLGCTFVYAALFVTGSFLYGRTAQRDKCILQAPPTARCSNSFTSCRHATSRLATACQYHPLGFE